MAGDQSKLFLRKAFILLTGASKGFGQSLAVEIAKKVSSDCVLLLVARNLKGLDNTKKLVEEAFKESNKDTIPGKPICHVQSVDLADSDAAAFENLFKQCLDTYSITSDDFENAIIIHNAGSLGDITKKAKELFDKEQMNDFFNVNLISTIILNSIFLKVFAKPKQYVVNISSLAAVKSFKTWSQYCAAKAARDSFFRTQSLESPEIIVLSYAPGPLDTDMQAEIRNSTADQELKEAFLEMQKDKKLLQCSDSSRMLIKVLLDGSYKSGSHVDYYDFQ